MAGEASSDELAKVHIAALRADATIGGYVADRVYDFVPRDTPYPYIIYHITDSDEWDTDDEVGEEHSVYIHVFDDKEGSKRARLISKRVQDLFHDNTAYSLTGHNLVNCRRVMATVDREGQLYHSIMLFRAVTEEMP